jgi:hypothetical protein
MTKQCNLNLVMLYDPRSDTYTLLEHNLDPEVALKQVKQIRSENLPAFMVGQTTRHRAPEADNCASCKRDIVKIFAHWPKKPKHERRKK